MATDPRLNLPPYPAQATPGDYMWVDWWRKLQDYMRAILAEINEIAASEEITLDTPGYYLEYIHDDGGITPPETRTIPFIGNWSVAASNCDFQFHIEEFPEYDPNQDGPITMYTGIASEFAMPFSASPFAITWVLTRHRTVGPFPEQITVIADGSGYGPLAPTGFMMLRLPQLPAIPAGIPSDYYRLTLSGSYILKGASE